MATEKELLREQLEFFLQKLKEAGPFDRPSLLDGVVKIMGELHKLEANEKFQSPEESFQDVEVRRFYGLGRKEPVEIECKFQSTVAGLPATEWRLQEILENEILTAPQYRMIIKGMAEKIRTYAHEEVTRVEYQWKKRAEKFIFALIWMYPMLVAVIYFVVRHL